MGAFDDLVPKAKGPEAPVATQPGGAFTDLVPKPEQPGMGTSALRGAVQGLTFGLSDESYGLTQGIASMLRGEGFSKGYDEGVTSYRARDKAAKEANPVTSAVGEVAGGMATGLGAAGAGATLMRQGMTLPRAALAGGAEGAAYGGAYGAGNAEGGLQERLEGAGKGAATGALVGAAVPAVARGIGTALRPLATSPERQAAVDVLTREGVPLSAGQRTGSTPLRYAESIFGDATLAGGRASRLMEDQAEAFTDAAMRRAGAAGRASPDNLTAARDRIGQEFTDLAGRNVVSADRQFATELGLALREYDRVLPAEQRRIVGELASDIVERFQAGNGNMSGRDYQTIRSRLSRMAQNARVNDPEFAQAIRTMRDGLDNNMGRSISPEDAAAWQQARREWGNLKVLERAASGGGENAAGGLISPQQLRIAASQGNGNRAGYARGEGDFAELARAGNVAMTPLPNSGTSQRNLVTGQAGGGGAALASGEPLTAAIIALGPSAFGRALWSGPIQRYLAGEAISPMAQQAIESRLRAALQGGAGSQSPRLPSPIR